MRNLINILLENTRNVPKLFHGTCEQNAESLIMNGWKPYSGFIGGNLGQTKYLYLSTGYDDALWFANEKGCNTVVELINVPLDCIIVDPEDGSSDTVEEELSEKCGLPGKVALIKPLSAEHFQIAVIS